MLLAYVVLGAVYAFATPIFEKNDEESHAWFVRYLAQGNGLPVQNPQAPDATLQREGSQPPLYYALSAPVFAIFNTADFETQEQPNPAPLANPYSVNNKNLLILTPEKYAFQYRDTTLAIVVLRLLGLLPGALVVWCAYEIAWDITRRQSVSLLATALTAFNPMFINVSTAVANDGLVMALSTLGILFIVRLALHGATARRIVGIGIVAALASLAKVSGALLLPVVCIAIVGRACLEDGPWHLRIRKIVTQGAVIGLIWLVIAGWWFVRNWVLYGDPTGVSVMSQMMSPRSISLWQALGEYGGFWMSYIAIFGQFTVHADQAVYVIFAVLLVAAVLGLLLGAGRWITNPQREAQRWAVLSLLVLALHVVFTLVSIVRWTMMTPASQGRLLFPAITCVSVLMALGLQQLVRPIRNATPLVAAFSGGAMFLLAIVAPFKYILPAYAPPLVSQLPTGMTPATQRLGDLAELVGYSMAPSEVRPGEKVNVSVVLRALSATKENFLLVVKLYGRDNVELARFDTYPGNGLLPTSQWRAGMLLRDDVEFIVPPEAPAPAVLHVQFELYNRGSGNVLRSVDANGQTGAPLFAGGTLVPRPSMPPATRLATAGDIGALVSYTRTQALPGQPMSVTLTWHTLRPAGIDYKVFVHLVDQAGSLRAQNDDLPDGGNMNTTRWVEGVSFDDMHVLNLPADLPKGRYRLEMGLYDPASGARLPLRDSHGASLPDGALLLDEIVID
jgi:4-amino-4-deoxy-L-arabinose transferase-like glycosyltransferase